MTRSNAALVLLTALLSVGVSNAAVPAVQKVVQMLTDMSGVAKQEQNDEQVEYAKFEQFCTDKTANKKADIKEGNELIEILTTEIAKLDSDVVGLGEKLDELHSTVQKSEAEKKAATLQREKDHKMFSQTIAEHAEAVDALERAISVMQKQDYDRAQAGEALLQLTQSNKLPKSAQRTVAAFLEMQTGDDYLTYSAPEANAYEFQSGGIVELLKKLRADFTQKHSEAEKEEMNDKQAFAMIKQDLTDTIENSNSDIASSSELLQEKKVLRAQNKKRLSSASATRDEDVEFLRDLTTECMEKGRSFQEKQGLRTEEIQALNKATEILSSPDVAGAADTHFTALSQVSHALVQLGTATQRDSPETRRAVVNFLKNEGHRLSSQRLGLLAQQVSSLADPFSKVKKLIGDLITKLLNEAGQDAEHKGWCDVEMNTNKQTRDKLQSNIDGLQAKIDEGKATMTDLTERLSTLADEITEVTSSMKQASELRATESAKNKATIKDAQAAQTAVASATAILKDFYSKASIATAFTQLSMRRNPVQYDRIGNEHVKMGSDEWNALGNPNAEVVDRGHKKGMQTFGETYSGQQDEAGGVLAMLEVIASDFSTLEANTEAAENEAVNSHRKFMADSKRALAVKERESSMLAKDKVETESRQISDTKDIKNTQDQLLAANRYYDRLKPQCIDQGMTSNQRVEARQAEINSLKEALKILSSEDVA